MSRVLIEKSKSVEKLKDDETEESKELYLTYEFNTNPSPIVVTPTISSDSDKIQSHADITIVVSNEDSVDKNKEFNKIEFCIPIGSDIDKDTKKVDSIYLTDSTKAISVIFSGSKDKYQVEGTKDGHYSITLGDGSKPLTMEGGQSFYITFHCSKVSCEVGNFTIEVREYDSSDNMSSNEFSFPKLPYGFYLNNFRAEPPIVSYGETATLKWDGAKDDNTKYYICASNAESKKEDFVSTENKSKHPTEALNSTTFFTLKAEYRKENGESAEYYLQTAVYVIGSDINATNITVNEDAKIKGTLYVNDIKEYKEEKLDE